MSEQKLALIDGTYQSLMAGGVVVQSGSLSSATNIDNYIGSDYWGKRYYFAGGQHPVGAPSGLSGGCLLIFQTGGNSTAQIIISNTKTDGSGRPVMYQRATESTAEEWSAWEEIVTSDGTYPTLGAGYLARSHKVGGFTNPQWIKIAEARYDQRSSIIFLVNGSNHPERQKSGLLELDFVGTSGVGADILVKILSGEIVSEDFCAVSVAGGVDLYFNQYSAYRNYGITVLSDFGTEGFISVVTLMNEGTGSATAPEGAVYAVVRNIASYAEMASHLEEIQINTRSANTVGWYKCGEFNMSKNTSTGDLSNSVLLLVNGTNYSNYSENPIAAAPSGIIEVDTRSISGVFPIGYSNINIIAGNITSNDFCIAASDNGQKLNVYVNISHRHRDFKITKLSEGQENVPSPNIFEFADEYYGTSAPEGAIYGIVRNYASADANGNSFDTNYLWHNNGQVQNNMLKDGTTSLDFNDYIKEGKYELHGNGNNAVVNFPISSLNVSANNCDWYLCVFVRASAIYVTQVAYSARADNAISIRSKSNGTWGEWRLLFEDGVAQQIPAASQTQLGGVYIFKDSDGYFNINTEQ